jgi:hypothetical protein
MPVLGTKEFLALPKAERIQAMKTGNYVAPREGTPERAEFNKVMFQEPAAPTPSPEPPKAPEQGIPPLKPTEEPPVPPAPAAEPPKDFGGYPTLEAFTKAHNEQKALLQRQTEIIDRINATNGNQGRELANLKKQLADVNKKIEEKKTEAPPEPDVVIAGRPNLSDTEKYPDGILDPKYQKDLDAYTASLESAARQGLSARKANQELSQKLDTMGKEFTEIKEIVQQDRTSKAQSAEQTAWDNLSQSMNELQQEIGITMTVPWTKINSTLLILNDESASPEARQSAQAFINALPPSDIDNYKKLRPVVITYADFSTGIPKPRFANIKSNGFRGTLMDMGFDLKPAPQGARPPAPPSPAPGVDALPASAASSTEPKLSEQQTGSEKQSRLRELDTMRKEKPREFNSNQALREEYRKLRAFFGAPVRA